MLNLIGGTIRRITKWGTKLQLSLPKACNACLQRRLVPCQPLPSPPTSSLPWLPTSHLFIAGKPAAAVNGRLPATVIFGAYKMARNRGGREEFFLAEISEIFSKEETRKNTRKRDYPRLSRHPALSLSLYTSRSVKTDHVPSPSSSRQRLQRPLRPP